MAIVTLSPKFQIVIPKKVREVIGLRPGDKLQVFTYGQRIQLFKVETVKALHGLVKGMDTEFLRASDEG